MIVQFIIGLSFLIILGILDLFTFNKKKGYIPAVLTTIFLLVAFILGSTTPGILIELGLFGALIGLLFTDLDLWGGIADYKIFVACSMLMDSVPQLLIFALVLTICAVMVKGFVKYKITKGEEWQIPFIPLIAIAFIVAGALGQ